jgi:uncharacterized membrane protein YgcG
MLRNEDFAKLLGSGGGGSGGNGNQDKVRYDMKQIRKWEQENKTQTIKQQNKKQILKEKFEKKEKRSENENSEYRDRAKERREDQGGEYEAQMEMVAQLSAEQTQYLGGDMEHTHLVKGLDYSLLKKVRSEVEQSQEMAKTASIATETAVVEAPPAPAPTALPFSSSLSPVTEHRLEDLSTKSHLGLQIKKFLLTSSAVATAPAPPSSSLALKKESILLSHRSLSTIARSAYEFDIDPLSMSDLPTTLMRSKDDLIFHNGYDTDQLCAPYVLPSPLFTRLHEVFHRGDIGIKERKEKKTNEQKFSQTTSAAVAMTLAASLATASLPSRIEPINIFDEDVGKYEPTLQLAVPVQPSAASVASSKNYFSSSHFSQRNSALRSTSTDSSNLVKEDVIESSSSAEPIDLLAPVKQLVAGQMIKQSILTNQRSSEMIIEAGKTHRDIFGGLETNDEAERRRKNNNGYSMMASRPGGAAGEDSGGEYEAIDNEMDDSDEEEGGAKKKKKKPPTNGQGGGGGGTSGAGGAPRAGGSSGGGSRASGGGNQAAGGLNRAARRALARGEGGGGDPKRSRLT